MVLLNDEYAVLREGYARHMRLMGEDCELANKTARDETRYIIRAQIYINPAITVIPI